MQIRFLMAQNNKWKMSFDELYPKISLLKNNTKKFIAMRLILLSEFKFLKLEMTDDEKHILSVEIPVTGAK
jgi:hypothetical protein